MQKQERKSRTSRLRRTELCVWIVILTLLILLGTILCNKYHDSFKSYNLYMPDVDGLIVGSPVYMMGIPIGHVIRTQIINDSEIRVKFKITNRTVDIPQGTIATVEFSGLGGSKSLQLYPPSSNKVPNELVGNNGFILVDRPKRLRDSMALLYQMYKTIMDIIYTATSFGNEVKNVKLPVSTSNASDFTDFLEQADRYMLHYDNNMIKIRTILNKYSQRSQ